MFLDHHKHNSNPLVENKDSITIREWLKTHDLREEYLSQDEHFLLGMLMEGMTLTQIGKRLDMTKQGAARRVDKLRRKMLRIMQFKPYVSPIFFK